MHARTLPARAGRTWLLEGLALYRRNPALLTSATMAYLMVILGISLLHRFFAFLVPLLQPTLALLLANVAAIIARGERPGQEALLYRFKSHRTPLLRLGGLQLALSSVLVIVSMVVEWALDMPDLPSEASPGEMISLMAVTFVIFIPLFLAFWFAPMLVGWHDVPPGKAVFFSLVAAWRNKGAFGFYTINVFVVMLLAGFVLALLMLLLPGIYDVLAPLLRLAFIMMFVPIMSASVYVSYVQIFGAQADSLPESSTLERDNTPPEGDA